MAVEGSTVQKTEIKWSSQEHCKDLNTNLNTLRQQRQLCDVDLIVEGNKFPAHRAVLAGASSYFQNLFTIDMKEKREGRVDMRKMKCCVMEDFLQFIYTGDVFLTTTKAVELLKAANYTNIFNLKNLCEDFLVETLSMKNCSSIQRLAGVYDCEKLNAACCDFIKINFNTVMELSEFLEMTEKELEVYLGSDDIEVNEEEEIYEGLVKWVKHQPETRREHFAKLFSCIRLGSLSKQFLFSVVAEEEMVCSNQDCSRMALKAVILSSSFQTIQKPRRCLEKTIQSIVVCGGCGEDECFTKSSFCYAPTLDKWFKLADVDNKRNGHAAVELDGFLYVIGGKKLPSSHQGATVVSDVSRYDSRNNSWSCVAPMPHAAASASAVTLKGFIFVLGGKATSEKPHIMQKYCPTTNRWQLVTPSAVPREHASCVSDGRNIFVIGGEHCGNAARENAILDSCEKYIPRSDSWEMVSPLSAGRSHAAATVFKQKIFVMGGCNESRDALGMCEVFSIAMNCWSRVASLQVPRRLASAVVADDEIYLLCGEDEDNLCVRAVECYSEEDDWLVVSQMPSGRSLTSASRLFLAKVFLESCVGL